MINVELHGSVVGLNFFSPLPCFGKAIKIIWCVLQVCTLGVHRSATINNTMRLFMSQCSLSDRGLKTLCHLIRRPAKPQQAALKVRGGQRDYPPANRHFPCLTERKRWSVRGSIGFQTQTQ